MSDIPFKLASTAALDGALPSIFPVLRRATDADDGSRQEDAEASGRVRLRQMDCHLHCSVLGTCLGTAELRKTVARFIDVAGVDDLGVHHDAVAHAAMPGPVSRALQKTLDHRHGAVVQRFAKARGAAALLALWQEALAQGEVPGAYWALLTHRDATPELRQRAFGDVHMLSHLVGAANRADIRRLVALETENEELRERLERQQERAQSAFYERESDRREATGLRMALEQAQERCAGLELDAQRASTATPSADLAAVSELVALQTARRESAEQAAAAAAAESAELRAEVAHERGHAQELARELRAVETQLEDDSRGDKATGSQARALLHGRRILYVGGRPSSTPTIRAFVERHGGEFQSHDGGFEERKGLLPAAVAWADVVVFPVDCIDHDSAQVLKRVCVRQGLPFVPLRSAGIASFVSSVAAVHPARDEQPARAPICRRHG